MADHEIKNTNKPVRLDSSWANNVLPRVRTLKQGEKQSKITISIISNNIITPLDTRHTFHSTLTTLKQVQISQDLKVQDLCTPLLPHLSVVAVNSANSIDSADFYIQTGCLLRRHKVFD